MNEIYTYQEGNMPFASRFSGIRPPNAVYVWSDDDEESVTSTYITDAVPPLTRGNSTVSSDCSAKTDMASSIMGEGYLLDLHEGMLTVPIRHQENADLMCPFQILDCDKVFADIVHFKMHVFWHFKGHMLPTSASCFLCDKKFTQTVGDDPALAWNDMLSHMVHDHYRRGQQLALIRTDFGLMRWMYNRKIITDHQFKRSQLVPIPVLLPAGLGSRTELNEHTEESHASSASSRSTIMTDLRPSVGLQTEVYTVNAGRRTERRRRDATRPMLHPRSRM